MPSRLDLNALMTSLIELAREISLAGIIDTLILTVFIYAGLVWLRRSKAKKVIHGVFIMGLFYLVSLQFNFYLTSVVLEAFFAVALVAAIVIFRDELRRLFERVARWRPAGSFGLKKELATLSATHNILVRTLSDLARDHIGALVVLKRKESIDIHLEGGVPLDGDLSEALLKSIFDVHSIGHDGAVVIENNRVSRFACHLPLSTRFDKLGTRGTRHAAALGLAERSDALCIVVSEERGVISLAKEDDLRQLTGAEELTALLATYFDETPSAPKPFQQLIRRDYRTIIAALGISMLLWVVLVHGAKQTLQRVSIPVDIADVPIGLKATVKPKEVMITLIGPRRNIYFFSKSSTQITLSLTEMTARTTSKRIYESDVTFPKDLTLRDIRPTRVQISLHSTTTEKTKAHRLPQRKQKVHTDLPRPKDSGLKQGDG